MEVWAAWVGAGSLDLGTLGIRSTRFPGPKITYLLKELSKETIIWNPPKRVGFTIIRNPQKGRCYRVLSVR